MTGAAPLLDGVAAVVTGGGGGIGRATAAALAARGAAVTISGRTEATLLAAAAAVDTGPPVRTFVADAGDTAQVRDLVAFAGEGGRLAVAVAVPGGGTFSPVLDYDEAEFERVVALNVMSPFILLKHAGAAMAAAGGGSFVAVSSTSAVQSSPLLAAYCAGKAALEGLVRVAADELGGRGVRVNAVRPGLTATDTTTGMVADPEVVDRYMVQQPVARVGRPEDVAAAICWLAGPESSWVTGQCVAVDGGHTLRRFPDLRFLRERRARA